MRITVLGKSPAWQDAGGACTGYLVEDGGAALLVDCGNGVFAKLRRYCDYVAVDGIVISHLHADHCFDLIPYAYALTFAPRQQPVPVDRWTGTDKPARPVLHVPPGAGGFFRGVAGALGTPDLIDRAFALREYETADEPACGPMRMRFHEVPHYVPTRAIEVSSSGGGRFTFGADMRPSADLAPFAHGTDLLVLEATLPRPERGGVRGHLTPAEAGRHGREAGARRLVLTHISDELDALWALEQARAEFGGPVEIAAEGAVYVV